MHEALEMNITAIEADPTDEGFHAVTIVTSRGRIPCRYFHAEDATRAVVWIPNAVGGWHSPAGGLYPALCRALVEDETSSLRLQYRYPNDLAECTLDVLAGLVFLESMGAEITGLIGHSFGGAVAIQAAAIAATVRTVVTISALGLGSETAAELAPRCSILLLHGADDDIVPPSSSELIHTVAREPKKLIVYEGADHDLEEVAEEVHRLVHGWIVQELADWSQSSSLVS